MVLKKMQKLIKNIPVLILCGGKATRLSEETVNIPKPVIKLDKFPILYHIMQIYLNNGFKEFIILTGYKHTFVKNYFVSKFPKLIKEKVKVSKKNNNLIFKNFNIRVINTGLNTLTGARILKCKKILNNKKYFAVTYGDGLANINIGKVFSKFYKSNYDGIICAANPEEKFGNLKINKNIVTSFDEKKKDLQKWINIGFFIFKHKFFKYLDKKTMLEDKPLKKITKKKKLMVYKHTGNYNCIDTFKEKKIVKDLIRKNKKLPWLN